jgi:hypothetical protein
MRWWNNCVEEGLGKKASKKKISKHGGVFSGERRMEPGERLTQVGLAQGPSGFLGADGAKLYFFRLFSPELRGLQLPWLVCCIPCGESSG